MTRVAVLTTSYPRFPGDAAGRFVADAVEHVRARGVDVEVVGPQQFRHYGIAYGHGMLGNLRRRPWLMLLVPALLAGFVRPARRVEADLLHAHWLPAGWVAARSGKPYVVQVWGTDVELANRAPRLARRVLRDARLVIAASNALADSARLLGAGDVRVPSGVDLPADVGPEADPAEILYAGRLSREKGVLELVEAARGLNLVDAGDRPPEAGGPGRTRFRAPRRAAGPLRAGRSLRVPFTPRGLRRRVSRGDGPRPAGVATGVGGLRDLVVDGETGIVVPVRDSAALRGALQHLLADRKLRRRLGSAGRERARQQFSWDAVTDATLAAYADAAVRMPG